VREKAINLGSENYAGGDGCDDAEPLLTQREWRGGGEQKWKIFASLSHNCHEDACHPNQPKSLLAPLQYIK
jgi:hypothetical protein